jgi:hypothetical protein
MDYNQDKVDQVVLALLYLNFHGDKNGIRAWKNLDWESLDRLHEKGYIGNPKTKAKSVVVYPEGQVIAKLLFEKIFSS